MLHVVVDLNSYLNIVLSAIVVLVSLIYLVKTAASKYFFLDDDSSNFHSCVASSPPPPPHFGHQRMEPEGCAVCGNITSKQCSRCKMVKYCSEACQRSHWNSGHKIKCKIGGFSQGRKSSAVSLVTRSGSSKILNCSKKVLFPYEEFLQLFNWDSPGFPPCGLLNCGNSCFANVVLQCLTYTKPLVAYLLEKGHLRECRRNDWCFLCEFQHHVERASRSQQPFSPINILSRLPNIGGNLGYGKQEDAHEFMRFAIDTMQSVCLDEFGGEKVVPPNTQETTLIQHIFGGHLQSQVICMECNNVSNQFENMMDLTVEIHGDAESLEECLDQFTAREWLDGDNLYKCDGCSDYVKAWKRLMVRRAPNVLTIALKRFQSGRFGKLNKRVTFPETLDLRPYMSEAGDGHDIYKLYAVIVHVDMLNASFFGHYICYIKDFRGSWYKIDDCKVVHVDLDEVLSQGAYMVLYSRIYPRLTSLFPLEPLKKEDQDTTKMEDEPARVVESASAPTVDGIIVAKEELSSMVIDPEDRMEVASWETCHIQQEVKPSSEGTGTSCPTVISNGASCLADDEIQKFEDDNERCRRTTNDCLLSEARNGEMLDGASTSASSSGDLSDNATEMPDKVNQKVNSDGGGSCSGPKLKPVFTPGFLGKCPMKRCFKKDASGEVCTLNAYAKPKLSGENHIHMEDQETSTKSKKLMSTDASNGDAAIPFEYGESRPLQNGHSAVPVESTEKP